MVEPFYTPEGQIADKDKAHEIANLEKPARDREAALAREAEVGLTAEQEKWKKLVDGIEKQFPNAFIEVIDGGERVLVAVIDDNMKPKLLVCSQDGIFETYEMWIEPEDIPQIHWASVIGSFKQRKANGEWARGNSGNWDGVDLKGLVEPGSSLFERVSASRDLSATRLTFRPLQFKEDINRIVLLLSSAQKATQAREQRKLKEMDLDADAALELLRKAKEAKE